MGVALPHEWVRTGVVRSVVYSFCCRWLVRCFCCAVLSEGGSGGAGPG